MILPDAADSAGFIAALKSVKGAYRADQRPGAELPSRFELQGVGVARGVRPHGQGRAPTTARPGRRAIKRTGLNNKALQLALEGAGAKGVLTSNWSSGWGVFRVFDGKTTTVPAAVSELRGLRAGLPADREQAGPGAAGHRGVAGPGRGAGVQHHRRPSRAPTSADEYVVLSAHFDSWDGSSGATDNGTGTVTMMEAMRILKAVLPNPSRTILVGHWSGEEQGLNGSRAYMADHPKVVTGLQALFNQDNGTGRVVNVGGAGLIGRERLPGRLVLQGAHGNHVELQELHHARRPGRRRDRQRLVRLLRRARLRPRLAALGVLQLHLAHQPRHLRQAGLERSAEQRDADRDAGLPGRPRIPQQMPRVRRIMPLNRQTGQQATWPECTPAARSFAEYTR